MFEEVKGCWGDFLDVSKEYFVWNYEIDGALKYDLDGEFMQIKRLTYYCRAETPDFCLMYFVVCAYYIHGKETFASDKWRFMSL